MPRRRVARDARDNPRRGGDLDLFAASDSVPRTSPAGRSVSLSEPAVSYGELGETFPGASPSSAVSIATLTHTAKDILEGAFMPL